MLLIFNDSFITPAIDWTSAEVLLGAVFHWIFFTESQVKVAHKAVRKPLLTLTLTLTLTIK